MAIVAVVGGLVLGGCGTSSGSDGAPRPIAGAPTSAPDATTTTGAPADPAQAAAAERYLDLVERPNCLVAAFDDAANEVPADATPAEAMAAVRPKAAEVAEAYQEFADGLDEGPWPPDAEALAGKVAAQLRDEAELFDQLANAADEDAFAAAFDALLDSFDERNDANALRAALGLEAAPIDDVDCSRAV
jgi:hypothetical protein